MMRFALLNKPHLSFKPPPHNLKAPLKSAGGFIEDLPY